MKVDTLLLLVNEGQIADAVPLQIDALGEGWYTFGKQEISFEVPFSANGGWRIVYELPEGCFEMVLTTQGLQAGDTVNLIFGGAGSTPLTACERPRAFAKEVTVPAP